jgi:hypothetical protein
LDAESAFPEILLANGFQFVERLGIERRIFQMARIHELILPRQCNKRIPPAKTVENPLPVQ